MEFFSDWITNIILFVLLAVVVELLLPQTSMQKYIKMVLGLLLIIIMLSPIIQLLSVDPEELISSFNQENQVPTTDLKNSIENQKIEIQAQQHAYILEEMAVQLQQLTEKELMDQFNLAIDQIQIVMKDETLLNYETFEEFVENIATIEVSLNEVKNNSIKPVEEVVISTTKPIDNASPKEVSAIQDLLEEQWGVDKEKIQITVERGN